MPPETEQNELFDDVAHLEGKVLGDRFEVRTALGPTLTTFQYVARDTAAEGAAQRVVLSVLPPLLGSDSNVLQQIEAAIEATQIITHDRVIRATEVVRTSEGTVVVTPWIEGVSFKAVLESAGAFSLDDVTPLLAPIAEALDVSAALGVVHGDVRPENIVIDAGGKAHITNFIIGRILIDRLIDLDPDALMAAIPWFAPETCEGADPARPQDIYGMGVCMYGAVTGGPPFSDVEVHDKLGIEPPPPLPADAGPAAPSIMKALSVKPHDRPGTCRGVLRSAEPTAAGATPQPKVEAIDPSKDKTFATAVTQAARDSTTYAERAKQRELEAEGIEEDDEKVDTNRWAMIVALVMGVAAIAIAGGALYGVMKSKQTTQASATDRPSNAVRITATDDQSATGPAVNTDDPDDAATTASLPDDDEDDPSLEHQYYDTLSAINSGAGSSNGHSDTDDGMSSNTGSGNNHTTASNSDPPDDTRDDRKPSSRMTREERKIEPWLNKPFALLSVKPAAKAVLGQPFSTRREENHGAWPDLPKNLVGMYYTPNDDEGYRTIRVLSGGVVMMAVYQTDWGDKDESGFKWKQELVSTFELTNRGWVELGDFSGFDWVLLARECKRGEVFTVRTKKYIAPILIFPEDALPLELRE